MQKWNLEMLIVSIFHYDPKASEGLGDRHQALAMFRFVYAYVWATYQLKVIMFSNSLIIIIFLPTHLPTTYFFGTVKGKHII